MQKTSSSALEDEDSVAATISLPTDELTDSLENFISDAVLLKRFIGSRDPIAFSMLVERYQRLVMGVALRQVGDRHRAEDVFQATFLILAEQAKKIRKPNSLASWLHGTARRIGLRALSDSQRQPTPSLSDLSNTPDKTMSDPALENVEHAFEQQALDEELAKLPEKLREPLVLHYLDGLTGREVAERLNLSVDTVEGRLKRGRSQLRTRLMRRGIGFGIVIAAFQMSQQTAVAASTSTLANATTASAVAWVSQQTLQGCSANAAHLAAKELAAMTAMKMTTMLACTAIICLTGGAIGAWALDVPGTGKSGKGPGGGAIETTLIAQAEPTREAIPVGTPAKPESTGTNPFDGPFRVPSHNPEDDQLHNPNSVNPRPIPAKPEPTGNDPFGAGSDGGDAGYDSSSGGQGSGDLTPSGMGMEMMDGMGDTMGVGVSNTIGTHIENRTYRKMSPSRKAVEEKLDSELQLDAAEIPSPQALVDELLHAGVAAMVDVKALEEMGLTDGQAGLGIRFQTPGMTLRDNLAIMLDPLDLTYIVKNGVLTITTQEEADYYQETVVYELRHLGANLPSEDVAQLLLEIPDSLWLNVDGNGGSVSVIPGGIVVSQTQSTHRKIVQLIEQLENFAAKSDVPQVQREPGANTPTQFIGGVMSGSDGQSGFGQQGGGMGGAGMQGGGGGRLF